jgi:hypothetical protein
MEERLLLDAKGDFGQSKKSEALHGKGDESEIVGLLEDQKKTKQSMTMGEAFRSTIDWVFTSRMFPTTVSFLWDGFDNETAKNAARESFGEEDFRVGDMPSKHYTMRALGLDGYDAATQMLTCADGTTKKFDTKNLTRTSFLLSLFALPSRPMTLDEEGRPQYSVWQVLYSLAGTSWNPVKETITGELKEFVSDEEGKAVIDVLTDLQETKSKEQEASLYKRRWTEKKGFLVALSVIRVPLFIAFNLVTWPFRFVRNLLKMVTVAVFPLLSFLVFTFNLILLEQLDQLGDKIEAGGLNWKLLGQIPAFFFLSIFTGAVWVVQYAMTLICRVGLAFSSPLTSALLAYRSGVLILGHKHTGNWFSQFVGVLGFVLSMALSATLWAITLPLALGALIAAVPALLTPITALSQSPFIATVLGWLTQLPFVATVSTAFGTAFGVVGGALTATFGAAVGYLGALVGVAIPQVVVTLSLVISVVVAPALTFVTLGVEALSNAIMQWVEQRPFHTLITKLKFWQRTEEAPNKEQNYETHQIPDPLYVHQAVPGGDYVVGSRPLHLVSVKLITMENVNGHVNMLEVTNPEQRKRIWFEAHADEGHSNQRSRMAKESDLDATPERPSEFKGIEKPVREMMMV